MASLLHINAHPPAAQSHTLRLAEAFLHGFRESHSDTTIDSLDLYSEGCPHLTVTEINAMYWRGERTAMPPEELTAWHAMLAMVTRFIDADYYLVTVPMWNLGVPSILKAYIDHIALANYTFRYTGPGTSEGLLRGRRGAIVSTRGGVYSGPPLSHYEMCVTYLTHIFEFLGIDTAATVVAEGLALVSSSDEEAQIMLPALARAREAGRTL